MKVIVSNVLEDNFVNFVVVKSFDDLRKLNGVDVVIIHRYSGSDFDAGGHVTTLWNNGNGIKRFVYISEDQSNTLKTIMTGVGGHCYDDEFYLEDEDELMALLEELDSDEETQLAVASPAIQVLDDFVDAFSNGDARAKTPAVLEQVKESVKELSLITQQQQLQLTTMGTSAIEIFTQASQIIKTINEKSKQIADELAKLEEVAANGSSSKATFSNSVQFFAPYTYRGNAKVLVIREHSPCRYLTSLALGYLHHLHYELNRRPKLVFVIQKGYEVAMKYSDYAVIKQENMNLAALYNNEIVATNNPKKEVMKDLLSKPNDVVVVVDRLYGSASIVSGRVTQIEAVGSRSDIDRFKVRPENTIFPVTAQPKQLFNIPTIKNWPVEPDARYAMYAQSFSDKYAILDAKIGLKVGD